MTTPDPNAAAHADSGLYGLDDDPDSAAVVVLPVPFDATCSYGRAAARGPEAILRASHQVELLDIEFGEPWKAGIAMLAVDSFDVRENERARALADRARESGDAEACSAVDAIAFALDARLAERTAAVLERGGLPVVLGGDHSTPLGAWRAAASAHAGLGLLHFDAHADLRVAYEGFRTSHASVVGNALDQLDGLARVVQVGLRDLCPEERARIDGSAGRVRALYDHEWARARLVGEDPSALVRRHLEHLPQQVWITLDIDGLDPSLCPHTGTPVPGGLNWHELALWLRELGRSGRRVIGCDLVEVAPGPSGAGGDSWDAVVGARVLYRLIATALRSRGELSGG